MIAARYASAIALFDAANAEDPRRARDEDGQDFPYELLYARRMTAMLDRFAPQADEVVRLAVRAQHIQRWKTPRDSYPLDRAGYLQWRTGLYRFHSETAARLMRQAGYDESTVTRVQAAIGKKDLKLNPDSQATEDVADLVFIEHYLQAFADKKNYPEDKWLDIIRKTWRKMSPRAQAFALGGNIRLPESQALLIAKAIGGS